MFESIENARRAAEEYRYPCIKEDTMSRALPYMNHSRRDAGKTDFQSTSIFVKGFQKLKWTHVDLYSKFCTFGKIISSKVSVGPDHKFLGFGYVQYSKLEEAQKAISAVSSKTQV